MLDRTGLKKDLGAYRRSFRSENRLIKNKDAAALAMRYEFDQSGVGMGRLEAGAFLGVAAALVATGIWDPGYRQFGALSLEVPIKNSGIKDQFLFNTSDRNIPQNINDRKPLRLHLGGKPSLEGVRTSLGKIASYIDNEGLLRHPYVAGASYSELARVTRHFGFNLAPIVPDATFVDDTTLIHQAFCAVNKVSRVYEPLGFYMPTSEFVETFLDYAPSK